MYLNIIDIYRYNNMCNSRVENVLVHTLTCKLMCENTPFTFQLYTQFTYFIQKNKQRLFLHIFEKMNLFFF